MKPILAAFALFLAMPALPAEARGAPDSFADLVERVTPAVVNISTTQRFGERDPQAASLGSGFIIDQAGLVVTNEHVIRNADEIKVILFDGREFPATLRAVDDETDLAVLEITANGVRFPAVRFGQSSKARVGDWVVAIGNPFGLGGSVSAGIVSAQERNIGTGLYDDYIQTDAAINRGNSGGPLFNMDGDVIGVNTVIYSDDGGSVGVGFAVNADLASQVVEQLIEFGTTRRGFLGVTPREVEAEDLASLGLSSMEGVVVAAVREDSPASRAGLVKDDVILRFGRLPIDDRTDLNRAVADTAAGETVELTVMRQGERLTLAVTLSKRERELRAAIGTPALNAGGLTLQAATDEVRRAYGIAEGVDGVVVTAVDPRGAISTILQPGDVIREIGWDSIDDPSDFSQHLQRLRQARSGPVQMLVQRGDRLFYDTINP
jgi:serine protease Do